MRPGRESGRPRAVLPSLGLTVVLLFPTALGLDPGAFDPTSGAWLQVQRVLPADVSEPGCWDLPGHAFGKFGWDLATDGDRLAVGMRGCTPGLPGAVYLYERRDTVWDQRAKVPRGDLDAGFGVSVALDGDVLVVGAPYAIGLGFVDHGAAYVFERAGDAWQLQATLLPKAPQDWGYFGMNVAVSGGVVAVSAHGEDGPAGPRQGAVYVYSRNDAAWAPAGHLVGPGARSHLGYALDLDGDSLLASTRIDGAAALLAYGGTADSWLLEQVLVAPDVAMAYSLDIDGDAALVGAPYTAEVAGFEVPFTQVGPVHTAAIGKALVLEKAGGRWGMVAELENPRHAPMEWFGYDVALKGDQAVVGAPGANPGRMGAAYVYRRSPDGWGVPAVVVGDDTNPADGVATTGDDFGKRVALSNRDAFVAAPFDTNAGLLPSPLDDRSLGVACPLQAMAGLCPGGLSAGTVYAFREVRPWLQGE